MREYDARRTIMTIIKHMLPVKEFSIGATAAIVTSMGLISGLIQGKNAKTNIIASLLIIAIADNISDSLGIHIYKESEGASEKEIKASTVGNFSVRLVVTLTFVLIVWVSSPTIAFLLSMIWGSLLLTILSYLIATTKKTNPFPEVVYHLAIAVLVIIGSRLLGFFITAHITG